jgi:hypothetical protein
MIDTTEAGRLPRKLYIANEGDQARNYAVWEWHKQSKSWLFLGRFETPQAAAERAGTTAVVIDIVSDTMIYWRGAYCNRVKPQAIPTLQMEKYT